MKHLNKVLFVFFTVCITLALLLQYDGSVLTVYAAGGSSTDEVDNWTDIQERFTLSGTTQETLTVKLAGNVTAGSGDERLLVPENADVTLDLNGYALDRGLTGYVDNGYCIGIYGKLTIMDSGNGGKITGGYNNSTPGGCIAVFGDGELVMESGKICDNHANCTAADGTGGAIEVYSDASFEMKGGTITVNYGYSGAGVSVAGMFIMSGGTIGGNYAQSGGKGGGVLVKDGGIFSMTGGEISGNNGQELGGGVLVAGTFNMAGGTLSGNLATSGGGVCVYDGALFTMSDGTISSNSAPDGSGGGVMVRENANLWMTKGEISGNHAKSGGGGISNEGVIYIAGGNITGNESQTVGGGINNNGTFRLDGNFDISGNTCGGSASNVNLLGDTVITITGVLNNSNPVGVTADNAPKVITSGLMPDNGTASCFESESEQYYIADTGTEAKLEKYYKVQIEAGSKMTKTGDSGAEVQYGDGTHGITEVIYTANTGYFFPSDYSVASQNGISVTRLSNARQIKISGYPSKDTTITLKDPSRKSLKISNVTVKDKEYDGTKAADLDFSNVSLEGLVQGDVFTVTATGTFEDENAGTGKKVTISNYILTGNNAQEYLIDSGSQTETTGNITQKEIGLAWSDEKLVYNGQVQIPSVTATNVVEGDSCIVDVHATGKTPGVYKANAQSVRNPNYKLPDITTADYEIEKKTIGLIWENTSFIYDGESHVPSASATGVVGDDECYVSVSGAAIDAGEHTAEATDLTGCHSTNYKLPESKTQLFTINTRPVTVSGAKAKDKYYDGTSAAEFDTSDAVIEGVLTGDEVTVADVTGNFENKDSREDKEVTVTGYALGGASAGNYAVSMDASETSLTATISPKPVRVYGIEAEDKEYDNTYDAGFILDKAVIEGRFEGDDLVIQIIGSFKDKEVGEDIEVEISSITFGGSQSHNYEVADNSQSTTTADILPKTIVCEWDSDTGLVYNGKVQVPGFKIDSTSLVTGDRCTAEVTPAEDGGGINAGEHTAKAELTNGNYQIPSGKETHKYSIARSSISDAVITGLSDKTYTGQVIEQSPTVKLESQTLIEGTDYTVSYKNNKDAGTAAIIFKGTGNYSGESTRTFAIRPKAVTPTVTLSRANYVYNSKVKNPAITVKAGSETFVKDRDYTVTYASGRKSVGTYNVTVKMKGNYSGSKTVSFKIIPKSTTLSKVAKAKKAAIVKWKKQAAKMSSSRITGYQIQLATNSKFTKNKKTVNVKGYRKTSKKVTGLKGGRKYYVRIRTYKKVGSSTYYSSWSKVKTVKTRK